MSKPHKTVQMSTEEQTVQKTILYLATAQHFVAKTNLEVLRFLYNVVFEPRKIKNEKLVNEIKGQAFSALNYVSQTYKAYSQAMDNNQKKEANQILKQFDEGKKNYAFLTTSVTEIKNSIAK
ncbi:MAG: hypothetical protein LBK26_01365 [Rickettsiales bacterium]|jgi:hypothetical protein|nr:hypothetical protein [Rickettsiales bacterium]